MNKVKTIKIKNEDGSISEESYSIAADAVNVDMVNGKNVQETIGTIDVDKDGDIAAQLNKKINKSDIIDNLNSSDNNKVLSAKQGKVLGDAVTALNTNINKKIYYFNTIAEMKADEDLAAGDTCQTLGYHSVNDGGSGLYQIVDDNTLVDDIIIHLLNNGLKAKLIKYNKYPEIMKEQVKYDDIFGICCHTTYLSQFQRDIDLWKALGTNRVRFDARWEVIETTKNVYNFSSIESMIETLVENDITPYIILNDSNALYAEDVTKRFQTQEETLGFINFAKALIDYCKNNSWSNLYFEIMNEPNINYCNIENYVEAIKEIYTYAKSIDENNIVVTGVTAGIDSVFLEEMFKLDSLNYTDYISIHPYVNNYPEVNNNNIIDVQLLIKKYSPNSPVKLIQGECGYSTVDPSKRTSGANVIADDITRSKYLPRMILNHLRLGINLSNIYAAYNSETDETNSEHWFRIVKKADGTPTETYNALLRLYQMLHGYIYIGEVFNSGTGIILQFINTVGNKKYVGWTTKSIENITIYGKQIILTDTVNEVSNINNNINYYNNIDDTYNILSKTYNSEIKIKGDINGSDSYETSDFNRINTLGVYRYYGSPTNSPREQLSNTDYGFLCCYSKQNFILQVIYSMESEKIYYRKSVDTGETWRAYKQIAINDSQLYNYRDIEKSDLNNCITTGYYNFSGGPLNNPEYSQSNNEYGILSVMNSGYYVSQQCHCFRTNTMWIRTSTDSGSSFGTWKQL